MACFEKILESLESKETLPLEGAFFSRGTVEVARELLGSIMVSITPSGATMGRVVEVEAYLGLNDPACHSYRGKTKRNAVMYGLAGHLYIYLIYGMHLCSNVTTAGKNSPEAVLLRGLEPLYGQELMALRRGGCSLRDLTSGPAKLAQAMGISIEMNGTSVSNGPVVFIAGAKPEERIVTTTRVGISSGADLPLRFYLEGNPFVSRKPTKQIKA